MPVIIVWAPVVASYCTVPAQVLPVVIGVADVLWVLIVPELVMLVTARSYVAMFSMPDAVVVRVVAVIAPRAVSVPEVLDRVRVV